jgi:hypothetical protein
MCPAELLECQSSFSTTPNIPSSPPCLAAVSFSLPTMRLFLFGLLGLGRLTAAVAVTTDNGPTYHGQGHDHDDHKTCVVIPLGHSQDDVPNILAAVDKCGAIPGGRIVLPAPYVYSINQRMTTHLENSTLEIGGTLHFSDDLTYWIENSYRFDFQNQSTAWRVTGSDYVVDGGPGMGGIDGNGQTWYTWAKNVGNVFGRPMPLHIVNSTRATFRNLSIRQQQFWAVLVETSSYIELDNFYVNATNSDSAAKSGGGEHYVQNTDGIDIYRSDHISITNWVYQGGDDAVALKGNSTNIHIENITVYGGPGIAFGSLGQYPDRYDIVENVTVKNIKVCLCVFLLTILTSSKFDVREHFPVCSPADRPTLPFLSGPTVVSEPYEIWRLLQKLVCLSQSGAFTLMLLLPLILILIPAGLASTTDIPPTAAAADQAMCGTCLWTVSSWLMSNTLSILVPGEPLCLSSLSFSPLFCLSLYTSPQTVDRPLAE